MICFSLGSRLRVLCTTSLTTDSRSDHMRLPVARPLWIPAFAGMTVVVHSTHRGRGDLVGFPVPDLVGEGEGLGLAAGVDEDYWGVGVYVSQLDFGD